MSEDISRPQPTHSELAILEVLWNHGDSTVRQVFEQLAKTREIGYTTVLKLMQIMVDKGLLSRTDQGRAHLYHPTEPPSSAKQSLLRDLMTRAFRGSAQELILHALSAQQTSSQEREEIRKLLDSMENRP
jgi:predicted transcriptional regulator